MPILIGGSGEKTTFALTARYANHLNIICDPADLPRKLAALDARCAEVGRDRSEIETSFLASAVVGEDGESAMADLIDAMRSRGMDVDALDPARRAALQSRSFAGTPEEIAAQIKARVLDHGVDGVIVNIMGNGHVEGVVASVGEALAPLVN
jgi:alkanesulfonate monooxygenase SsuD/methylene tetrahydromethanopterin reductase-like flavin-dependent oxidoreductase (luciferase family)